MIRTGILKSVIFIGCINYQDAIIAAGPLLELSFQKAAICSTAMHRGQHLQQCRTCHVSAIHLHLCIVSWFLLHAFGTQQFLIIHTMGQLVFFSLTFFLSFLLLCLSIFINDFYCWLCCC